MPENRAQASQIGLPIWVMAPAGRPRLPSNFHGAAAGPPGMRHRPNPLGLFNLRFPNWKATPNAYKIQSKVLGLIRTRLGEYTMNMLITHKGVGRHPPPAPKQRRPSSQAARRDKQVSIVFLDPRPLTRECFSRWLGASARDFRILPVSDPAEVPNGGGASADDTDLILVNIGGADVTEATVADTLALLHRDLPDTPVVVLADHEGVEPVVEAIRRGVRGYIPTSLPLSVAIEALRFVHAGGTFVPASVLAHSLEPERAAEAGLSQDVIQPDLTGFTGRELEVLERLCQGKPNKIIAFELNIRDATVKVHVRHIMKKLRVTNRTQVVCLARQLLEQRDAPAAEDRSLRARLADWRRP